MDSFIGIACFSDIASWMGTTSHSSCQEYQWSGKSGECNRGSVDAAYLSLSLFKSMILKAYFVQKCRKKMLY